MKTMFTVTMLQFQCQFQCYNYNITVTQLQLQCYNFNVTITMFIYTVHMNVPQLIVEDEFFRVLFWNIDADFGSARCIGEQDSLRRSPELQSTVEEHRPDERQVLELCQVDRSIQELPLPVGCPEFLDELVRIGEEVMFVVFVMDLVLT